PAVPAEYVAMAGCRFAYGRWRLAVYQKHRQGLTLESLVRIGARADAIEAHAAEMRDLLAQEREARSREAQALWMEREARSREEQALRMERDALRAEVGLLRGSVPQRLGRFPPGHPPPRLPHWPPPPLVPPTA